MFPMIMVKPEFLAEDEFDALYGALDMHVHEYEDRNYGELGTRKHFELPEEMQLSFAAKMGYYTDLLLGDDDWPRQFWDSVLMPVGSSLALHNDHVGNRVGAFVYYYHQYWEPGWGGELVFYSTHNNPVIIHPEPNTLVLFTVGEESWHEVREVKQGLRKSLTGWWLDE